MQADQASELVAIERDIGLKINTQRKGTVNFKSLLTDQERNSKTFIFSTKEGQPLEIHQ